MLRDADNCRNKQIRCLAKLPIEFYSRICIIHQEVKILRVAYWYACQNFTYYLLLRKKKIVD